MDRIIEETRKKFPDRYVYITGSGIGDVNKEHSEEGVFYKNLGGNRILFAVSKDFTALFISEYFCGFENTAFRSTPTVRISKPKSPKPATTATDLDAAVNELQKLHPEWKVIHATCDATETFSYCSDLIHYVVFPSEKKIVIAFNDNDITPIHVVSRFFNVDHDTAVIF